MSFPTYLDTHTAIVGASGAGKTVTAKVQVEALLAAGRHVCILDPTGAWWGMRSNAAGDGPGFDIPIFGGSHGDVAITADQGEAVGAIVADGVSAIIDISGLRTGSEQRRFARDLCRRLRAKPDGNFHFVVDEADEFAAQKPRDDYGFQVGEELIWMAKRGRLPGFVLTLITQRPASIDKEVLSQAQTLMVHQLVAPVDQKPIVDYLKEHADKATLTAIKSSLASLDRGERWVYAPRMGLLERGVSTMPGTFDSSKTIGPGEQATEPKMLAQIDLGAIREKLAPPVEETTALNDLPATHISDESLKRRLAELEAERDEWIVERGVGQQQLDALAAENGALREIIGTAWADIQRIQPALAAVEPFAQTNGQLAIELEKTSVPSAAKPANEGGRHEVAQPKRQKPQGGRVSSQSRPPHSGGIPASQQRVLDAIAWWAAIGIVPVERNRASVIAGLSPKASTFGVYISKLAQAGLVDTTVPGCVSLTEAGQAAANSPGEVNRREVVQQARSMLKPSAANVFDEIVARYPDWIERGELADIVGLSRTASTLGVYISESSKLGFVETKPGKVRAADWMMP